MTNWMNLVIIGAVIIVLVVFVLPIFSGSNSGQGGSVGGGLGSIPSGDIGQGGLPTTVYEITNNYLPPTTAGVNAPASNESNEPFSISIGNGIRLGANSPIGSVASGYHVVSSPDVNIGNGIRLGANSPIGSVASGYHVVSSNEGSGKSSTHIQETVGRSSGTSQGSNTGNWFNNNSGTPKTIGKPSSGGHVGNVRA